MLGALALKAIAPAVGEEIYYVGFGGNTKRWGFNEIEGRETFDDGAGSVIYLVTDFDISSPVSNPNETHANNGDSGGAAFSFNPTSNQWEVAGVMLTVRNDRAPVRTFSARVFDYRAQIMAAAAKSTLGLFGF